MQDVDLRRVTERLLGELITLAGHTPSKDAIDFYMKNLEPHGFENIIKMLHEFLPEQTSEYPMPSIRELRRRLESNSLSL
jgi:hypothetical protein